MSKQKLPQPAIWLEGYRAAMVAVREALNGPPELVGKRKHNRPEADWRSFWFAVYDLIRAIVSRPLPAKFARADDYARELAKHTHNAFEAVIEDGKTLRKMDWCGTVNTVYELEEIVKNAENPPPRRLLREDPKSLLALPGMSTTQVLKMCPWLTEEQLFLYQGDPVANPLPPEPTKAEIPEPPPIMVVRGDLFDSVRALVELRAKVLEREDERGEIDTEILDESLRDESLQDGMAAVLAE